MGAGSAFCWYRWAGTLGPGTARAEPEGVSEIVVGVPMRRTGKTLQAVLHGAA
jgi:hypothetical protein